jgi:hypothetical protein
MSTVLTPRRRVYILLLLLLILLLLLLIWLLGRPAEPVNFTCVPSRSLDSVQTTAFFVDRQVIVVGAPGEIDAVMDELAAQNVALEALEDCDLGYLGRSDVGQALEAGALPQPPLQRGRRADDVYVSLAAQENLSMRLYTVTSSDSIASVVAAINDAGAGQVFADPNYLVGPLAVSPCGDPARVDGEPFEVGGSPFEVGGSPFEVGGSPHAGPGAEATADIFMRQWAFEVLGITYPTEQTGAGVSVGVFDTSPFEDIEEGVWDVEQPVERARPTSLTLRVVHPSMLAPLAPLTGTVTVADHGLFVAGLVHAVVPSSTIHLVRVLNEFGCGDLNTLNKALHTYIDQMSDADGRLDGVVINLSLGIHQPQDTEEAGLPEGVASLRHVLLEAESRGAVVVAASGNDSAESPSPVVMQLPADYAHVIGVAATNTRGARACYSNLGDVGAPGADGRLPQEQSATCAPRANECAPDDAGCELGVVSLSASSSTGYRFWVGSSFAAPLVSGLAARLLEAGGGDLTPRDVRLFIVRSATMGQDVGLGEGIIYMPESLP